MQTRYAITHLAKDGLRALAFANQGRNHYNSESEAQAALELYAPQLRAKIGMVALEVRPVECYDNGDATGIYFPMNLHRTSGTPFTAQCAACLATFTAGDTQGKLPPVYADSCGTPWKAYYCEPCAAPALRLQEVTSHV